MRNIDEDTITQAVLASFAACRDDRLRTLITSLVQHLHAFVRDSRFTEVEWAQAIQFLTDTGRITTEKRQEFTLLSDTLGVSMLVKALNSRQAKQCTESTVLDSFPVEGMPQYDNGAEIARGMEGEACWVSGSISDLEGRPVAGAVVDVWQAEESALDDVQYPRLSQRSARGRFVSRENGTFNFKSIVASPYRIPHDGPVGKMLAATGRQVWRPAHLQFMITAQGFRRLTTQIFRRDDRYLDSDAVFGVRSTLITDWLRHSPGIAPDGSQSSTPFYTLDYQFVIDAD